LETVQDIRKALAKEEYAASQIHGPTLNAQLSGFIRDARARLATKE